MADINIKTIELDLSVTTRADLRRLKELEQAPHKNPQLGHVLLLHDVADALDAAGDRWWAVPRDAENFLPVGARSEVSAQPAWAWRGNLRVLDHGARGVKFVVRDAEVVVVAAGSDPVRLTGPAVTGVFGELALAPIGREAGHSWTKHVRPVPRQVEPPDVAGWLREVLAARRSS